MQRKSASVLPLSRCVTTASQSCVVRPRCWARRDAGDRALARGAEEIGLELDGRESGRALGQVRDAAVAAGGVGERHDGAGVQVAVRRDVVRLDGELRAQFLVGELGDDDAHVAGQEPGAAALELLERDHARACAQHRGGPDQAELRRELGGMLGIPDHDVGELAGLDACRAPCAGRARARRGGSRRAAPPRS